MAYRVASDYAPEVLAAVEEAARPDPRAPRSSPTSTSARPPRAPSATQLVAELAAQFAELDGAEKQIKAAFRSVTKAVVRSPHRQRGRSASTAVAPRTSGRCRPRSGVLPSVHGSGLFQRGETQVLNVATLGMPRMEQMIDALGNVEPQALHAPLQLPAVLHR